MRTIWLFEAKGWFHVNGAIDISIEECCFNIEDVEEETVSCCMSKYKADRCRFDDRGKGIFKVDVSNLSIAFGDEPYLEARV